MTILRLVASMTLMAIVTTTSQAATLFGNPGNVGLSTSSLNIEITDDFKSAFGSTVSGQGVQLDLVFTDQKQVEPPSDQAWDLLLIINHDSVGIGNTIPPIIQGVTLNDGLGQAIRSADGLFNGSSSPGQSLSISEFDTDGDMLLFRGVSFDVTLPNYGSTPNITEVLVVFSSDSPLTVIPEPASLALLGLALILRRR